VLTPNNSFLILGFYVHVNVTQNHSRNTTPEWAQMDRQTDAQTRTGFIVCPMLRIYGVPMEQIINRSERYSPPGRHAGGYMKYLTCLHVRV